MSGLNCENLTKAHEQISFLVHNFTTHEITIRKTKRRMDGSGFERKVLIRMESEDVQLFRNNPEEAIAKLMFGAYGSYIGITAVGMELYGSFLFRWK